MVKGKIAVKARNKKGFKIDGDDNWFTAEDPVIPYLEKIEKGDEVEITFSKNGVFKNVTKIVKIEATKAETKPEEKPKTGFTCADCGKELPDGKYKKCYTCNKKSPAKSKVYDKSEKTYTKSYDNPTKTAQIQRGNALNAAGYAISGNLTGSDPNTIKEAVLLLANAFLDWIRVE